MTTGLVPSPMQRKGFLFWVSIAVILIVGTGCSGFSSGSSSSSSSANGGLQFSVGNLPGATLGATYSATITATGGSSPYGFTVVSGTLPPGLALASSNGKISGTPTSAGQFSFTVQVVDSSSPAQKTTKALAISVSPPPPLVITGSINPQATIGVAYSSTDQATGGFPPYTWSIVGGALPPGLTLAATTGTISGTPNQTGAYTFTIQVRDSSSPPQSAKQQASIAVAPNPLDQYGGIIAMPSSGQKTGVFRLEKFPNNKWMFVDPDNNAFFMTSIYVLDQSTSKDDMGGDYYDRTTAKYGDPDLTWGPAQVSRMQSWGFNTVGPFSSGYTLAVKTNNQWPGDGSNPVKAPFIGFFRPSFYAMTNQSNWAPQPVKDMFAGVGQYYPGYRPYDGIADYYDSNWDTFLANELANDYLATMISSSPYKQYMIGVSLDDSDDLFGFGAGPDFTTEPQTGSNNPHLGWLVLVMSPQQTASSQYAKVYSDTTVYSKKALHDQMVAKYGTISALNTAWGSNYTTFDSSGSTISGEAVGKGDGTTRTFNKSLANTTVTQFSLQILVSGTPAGGDLGDGTLWGPGLSGSINYSTGALSVTFSSAPPNGANITANYAQNGWAIGSGLMDEDGRPSHQGWVGKDYTYMKDVNPNLKADLDVFLYQIANHYLSTGRAKVEAWMPGVLFMGPTTLGTWSVPSNRNVLKAAAQSLDVMVIGGGWPLSQAELDFIYKYYGDKPIYVGAYRTANADSAFWRYTGGPSDFPTQANRGQDYYNAALTFPTGQYSANGSRPYVGVVWWQYLDNWGEKADWGLVSLSDNAYDSDESVIGPGGVGHRSIPCSPPLEKYLCGGEERNYGDVITPVQQAHQQIVQGVQK